MLLFKVLQKFLLPSVFVLILALIGLFLLLRKKRMGTAVITVSLLLYYLFSISIVANLVLAPLESQYPQIDHLREADKVVLLLGRGEDNVLRASEVLRIYFARDTGLKVIISGRNPLGSGKNNIGKGVKDYLQERGVLPGDIILESQSRNTYESAQNVKELVGQDPFFLVTSAYHMPRSVESFKKLGTNPIPAPTDFKADNIYSVLDFFPAAHNLQASDLAFHEYFGILYYRIRY